MNLHEEEVKAFNLKHSQWLGSHLMVLVCAGWEVNTQLLGFFCFFFCWYSPFPHLCSCCDCDYWCSVCVCLYVCATPAHTHTHTACTFTKTSSGKVCLLDINLSASWTFLSSFRPRPSQAWNSFSFHEVDFALLPTQNNGGHLGKLLHTHFLPANSFSQTAWQNTKWLSKNVTPQL